MTIDELKARLPSERTSELIALLVSVDVLGNLLLPDDFSMSDKEEAAILAQAVALVAEEIDRRMPAREPR